MTSKESLKILFASYHYDGNYQDVIEAREKLEQDLEDLEVLISILQKFIDNEEYVILTTNLTLGIDGGITLTQNQCDTLKRLLKFKEGMIKND